MPEKTDLKFYLLDHNTGWQIFRGSLNLALSIAKAFDAHGIKTVLAVEKPEKRAITTD